MAAFREAFQNLQFQEPTLQTGSSYSFPTFTVIFANETDMKIAQAEGRLGIFKRSISELYGHCGSESNPFDAARAVSALYVGWEADFQESFQLDPSGNTWLARMNNAAEQAGTGQPATRSLSDSEGSDKPQPGAEGRSR